MLKKLPKSVIVFLLLQLQNKLKNSKFAADILLKHTGKAIILQHHEST